MQFVNETNAREFVMDVPVPLRTELVEILAREELIPEELRGQS